MKNAIVALALVFAAAPVAVAQTPSPNMNFFVTSVGPGDGANLGGLEGADAHCQALAQAVGSGDLTWRAYLSTTAANGQPAVNARDRIGTGPWFNFNGDQIAANLDQLHSEQSGLTKETALTEKGQIVGGFGDTPNQHDILTGSLPDGTAPTGGEDQTCSNWTSNGEGAALVGHSDRNGPRPDLFSWNSAHASRGCSQEQLISTGGNGLFYCFGVS